MSVMLLRPARISDLSQIERLAEDSGTLVCTLPATSSHLRQKIERSMASFRQEVICPGEESYFFVLEEMDSGRLYGTAGVNALAGGREPFYSFRNDVFIHSSTALNVHRRIHALTMNHDLSDHSQLCSFYIDPAWVHSRYPALLTLGRLQYMSMQPERFSEEWMAVMPGMANAEGQAPFWENVGRKFFDVDYSQVEFYNGTRDKTFIAELMPHHSLYVPLMAPAAQAVIGLVHPDAQLPYHLLSNQGFVADKYVEIFDGGAIISGHRNAVNLTHHTAVYQVCSVSVETVMERACDWLIGFMADDGYRALMATAALTRTGELAVAAAVLQCAGLQTGDRIWGTPVSCNEC